MRIAIGMVGIIVMFMLGLSSCYGSRDKVPACHTSVLRAPDPDYWATHCEPGRKLAVKDGALQCICEGGSSGR